MLLCILLEQRLGLRILVHLEPIRILCRAKKKKKKNEKVINSEEEVRATTTATLCLCTFCFLGMTQDGLSWVLGYKHKQASKQASKQEILSVSGPLVHESAWREAARCTYKDVST